MRSAMVIILALHVLPALCAAAEPSTTPAVSPSAEAIPRGTLEVMYRRELQARYDPDSFEALFAAHQLIENYFAAPTAKEQADLTKQLEAANLDVATLARLTRIRLHWPELRPGV